MAADTIGLNTTGLDTVSSLLAYQAKTNPDSEAAIYDKLRISYAQLQDEVDIIAKALIVAGVEIGDRVGIMTPPNLDFYLTYLAAASIGGIWFGLNPRYQEPEYKYLLDDTKPKIIFAVSPFEERDYSAVLQAAGLATTQYIIYGQPSQQATSYQGFISKADQCSGDELRARQAQVKAEDIAAIVYTSGSTGEPKGAMLSHGAIVQSAITNAKWMASADKKPHRALCCLPINHVAALNNLCMNVMAGGGCMVFNPRFDLGIIIETTKSEKLTYMLTSRTLLMMLLAYNGFNFEALKSLKLIIFGGAATPKSLIEQYMPIGTGGAELATIYGLSETCGIISHSKIGASLDVMANSIGKPIEGASWRVCDAAGKSLGVGEIGELQISGPHILSGYYNKPDASGEAMTKDGYFRTGDLCKWRADGNVEFTGRLKEMFKSGGYNIYPLEVEQAIEKHPNIAMAIVVSVPHELYQEVGYAFIKPTPGQNISVTDLKTFLRTQIANYKIPKQFQIMENFPTLPNTKVDKMALQKMLRDHHA